MSLKRENAASSAEAEKIMTEATLIHKGHRQRMRDKLLSYGGRVMQNYELLEMLLFYVIPCKNTNPVAKRLMLKFGSLDGVFSASSEELCEVEGVGKSVAEFIKNVALLLCESKDEVTHDSFDDYDKVGRFLVDKLSGEKEYKTVMLVFDNRMNLIDYKVIYELEYSSGAVRAEAFIDFAVKTRAAVAITAHNHPYGPLFPTVGDMATNNAISTALGMAGINHAEHYIISGNRFLGITNQLCLSLGQSPEINRFYESRREALGV